MLTRVNLADLGVAREALAGCVLGITQEAAAKAGALGAALEAHQLFIASGAGKGAPGEAHLWKVPQGLRDAAHLLHGHVSPEPAVI